MAGPSTEIWAGDYCFRVDHSAAKYGRANRRVYVLVGFEGFHSISYDPDRPGVVSHPWTGGRGVKFRHGTDAAKAMVKQIEGEIAEARRLVAAADAHSKKRGG